MQKTIFRPLLVGLCLTGLMSSMTALSAAVSQEPLAAVTVKAVGADAKFRRIATLANYLNNSADDIGEETVSEIVAATADGNTLVYTDGTLEQIGLIDITDPANPSPAGVVPVGGEPTSVDVLGNEYALVAVNTSTDFVSTGGLLHVVDLASRSIVRSIDLGGQPDSIKISSDGRYVAVVIENERDEDIEVEGVEGGLPQAPAGYLTIIDIVGASPADWTSRDVALTGLAGYGGDDPEPEFVDVNAQNQAVVTLQENNHIVLVDLASGSVAGDFDAGTVSLSGVDNNEDGVISLTDDIADVPREPDAVTWVSLGGGLEDFIATANEGDLFGGSRGFSVFNQSGGLLYDSGTSLEEIAVRHGHYPEERSENKGSEPEAVEFAQFENGPYLFVGSERGSFVAVYGREGGAPAFQQLLPGPLGPEGLLAIPSRNLLIASGEEDDPSFGVRSSIMIYQLQDAEATYPQILSADKDGKPIAWSALSGMVASSSEADILYAVWDSFYSESRIFRIDVSSTPALITDVIDITGGSGNYDPEGIAIAPDGSFWIASEGNASGSRANRLLQVDSNGNVLAEIGLPQNILDCRAASTATGTLGSGFEGVTVLPGDGGNYRLLVAQQRGWDYTTPECEALDDDDGGLNANGQPNRSRGWIYDVTGGEWSHIAWELSALPENASWVGLSEVTRAPDGSFLILERDNRSGDFAALKSLVRVSAADAEDGLVTQAEKQVYDLLPEMRATHGWVSDKPEGVAVTADGSTYLVTDNDGVDDWSGETSFLRLGEYLNLFQ